MTLEIVERSFPAQVDVTEHAEVYHHAFLQVFLAKLRYQRLDGAMSDAVTRLAVKTSNAVGVLAYDPRAKIVVLVRQFRYPVYEQLEPQQQAHDARAAWMLEIVAGLQEDQQSTEETARRELREETGYEVTGALTPIATVYTSPGSYAEQIALFFAEVDTAAPRGGGGGVDAGEDTALIQLPVASALAMLQRGEVRDAKTVIALQYLALRLTNGD